MEAGFPAVLGSYCKELPRLRAGYSPLSMGLEEEKEVCLPGSYPASLLHGDYFILTTTLDVSVLHEESEV